VKEGLCVLIKYGFVTHRKVEEIIEYTLHQNKIIMILRYPRYAYILKWEF